MTYRPVLPASSMRPAEAPFDGSMLLTAAIVELEACDKRNAAFGRMIVGQEVWRLLLTLYVDQVRAASLKKRSSDFEEVHRRWLKVLAVEGMLEADASNRLSLSDRAVRCVEQCLAR